LAAEVLDPRFELYAITDQKSSRGRSDLDIAKALIQGGVSCLQYRAKSVPAAEQHDMAKGLSRLCKEAGVTFIVNDRVDLALECGADGVHLGQDDMPIQQARQMAGPGFLIGRSTHSLAQAVQAWRQGADYIGFGPLYPTQTKENNVPALGLEELSQAVASVGIPLVAIGGIKLQHLASIASEGARHVAAVTALTQADDVAEAAKHFRSAWRLAVRDQGRLHA
jgi:thiamine-phosphate pyrophosphorylase